VVTVRRIAIIVVLILTGSLWPAAPALASGSRVAQPAAAESLQADFNNDGADDLAVGVPEESVAGHIAAGVVQVLSGSATGVTGTGSQLFTQVGGAVEANDDFGFALTSGDFNNNGFDDLAAGAPGETVGGASSAGAVSVLYGSAGGLSGTGGQLFTQVGGAVESFDAFGFTLQSGDFNNNGFADLAASAVFEAVGSISNAGAVSVLYGSAGGLTRTGGQLFTQNSPGVLDSAEQDDRFGDALATR
jgi:hypothetical protein